MSGDAFFEDAGAGDVLARDAGPVMKSTSQMTTERDEADVRSAGKLNHSGRESDSSRVPRSKRPWWSALATAALLLLAGLPWLTAGKQDPRGAAFQPASVSAASRHGYVPIEQLRVGDRVLAENPEHSAGEAASDTQVDPSTWRHLVLEADYRWPDGTPDPIRVETLQSPNWIAAQGAEVGQLVDLPLDLVEMGLPADLRARVLENRSCPTLAHGPGRVVLTTVHHLHNRVVDLRVRDAHGRLETLRPTCFHKFFSQTRHAWVSAQDLQVDEVLAGLRGAVTVVSTAAVPGIHRVYNLTVEGEHVYCVGATESIAHNTCHEAVLIRNKRTIIGDELPFDDAVIHVRDGGDLVTDNIGEARRVGEDATGHPPLWHGPGRGRDGYPIPGHFHPVTPDGVKLDQHIIPLPRR